MTNLLTAATVLVAVLTISTTEYINRTTDDVWRAMLYASPLIVIGQVALYFLFSRAPSVMAAWLVFTLAMSASRIFMSTMVLREPLHLGWLGIGVGLMITAALCLKQAHNLAG